MITVNFVIKYLRIAFGEVSSIFLETGKTMFFVTEFVFSGIRKKRSNPQVKENILVAGDIMAESDWQAIVSDVAIVGRDMRKGMDLYVKRTRTDIC